MVSANLLNVPDKKACKKPRGSLQAKLYSLAKHFIHQSLYLHEVPTLRYLEGL